MNAFKGFNRDLTCRGYQFEIGKTYEEQRASLCESGFHACEYPLDVFAYYPPATSRYAEVELDGVSGERRDDDTKVCAQKITIKAELDLPGIIKAAVEYTFAHAKKTGKKAATGYRGAASATGYRGAASATGDKGIACAHGIYSSARGALGNWIVLSEWRDESGEWQRINVKAFKVDGKRIKPDIFYTLKCGKAVKYDEE